MSPCFIEIQSLILRGRITEALGCVRSTYPGLLESHLELLFKLKCRQFVEMIGGYDTAELLAPPTPTPPPTHTPTPPPTHTPTPTLSQEPRLSCHSELSFSSGEGEEVPLSPPPLASPIGVEDDGAFVNGAALNGVEDSMEVDNFTASACSRHLEGKSLDDESIYS